MGAVPEPVTMLDSCACRRCGALLDVRGLFPGARVVCACGEENLLSVRDVFGGPYRTAARPSYGELPPVPKGTPAASFLRCPRCSIPMPVSLEGEVDEEPSECDRCHGTFVPWELLAVALARAQEHVARPIRTEDGRVTYLRCPACGEHMNRTLYSRGSGIIVDVCNNHGLWFDAGELERAVGFRPGVGPRRRRPSDP